MSTISPDISLLIAFSFFLLLRVSLGLSSGDTTSQIGACEDSWTIVDTSCIGVVSAPPHGGGTAAALPCRASSSATVTPSRNAIPGGMVWVSGGGI